ncbi:hypothetical protein GCM10028820_10680 [Tessaracoccus terricola]
MAVDLEQHNARQVPGVRVAPTTRFRRVGGALALPAGFALQVAANSIYAVVSTESGLTDTGDGAEALEFFGRYPAHFEWMTVLALSGVLLIVPGLLAALRVLRPHRPVLGLVAVTLMVAGYVCYFGIVRTNFDTIALAEHALAHPSADLGAVLDNALTPAAVGFALVFVVGNLLGTLLLGLAVLSSPGNRVVGLLVICWPVGHVANLLGGGEWFAVAGGALEVVGLSMVAARALRTTDPQWVARG